MLVRGLLPISVPQADGEHNPILSFPSVRVRKSLLWSLRWFSCLAGLLSFCQTCLDLVAYLECCRPLCETIRHFKMTSLWLAVTEGNASRIQKSFLKISADLKFSPPKSTVFQVAYSGKFDQVKACRCEVELVWSFEHHLRVLSYNTLLMELLMLCISG